MFIWFSHWPLCVLFSPGYYCPQGQTVRNPSLYECPAGYYCPTGSSINTLCDSGYYQDLVGQATCKECPAGFYCDNSVGSITSYSAYVCPEGLCCRREIHRIPKPWCCFKLSWCGLWHFHVINFALWNLKYFLEFMIDLWSHLFCVFRPVLSKWDKSILRVSLSCWNFQQHHWTSVCSRLLLLSR